MFCWENQKIDSFNENMREKKRLKGFSVKTVVMYFPVKCT